MALQHRVRAQSGPELLEKLRQLFNILDQIQSFDSKLADYIFFPLTCVFQQSAILPSMVTATAVRCLDKTVEKGWNGLEMQPDLIKQLLIFLSIYLERGMQGDRDQDILEWAFKCLTTILEQQSAASSRLLRESGDEFEPVLGQLMHMALTTASKSSMSAIQSRALIFVNTLIQLLPKPDILRKFFPGIVSQLTSILHPSTQNRRNFRVLVLGLKALQNLFDNALREATIEPASASALAKKESDEEGWTRSFSSQVLLAFSKIVKLESHTRVEVRDSLLSFCCLILRKRSPGLGNCFALMLKSAITLCSMPREHEAEAISQLQDVVLQRKKVQSILEESCFKWLSSLPHLTQLSDKDALERETRRITYAYRLLHKVGYDTHALGETWIQALGECLQKCLVSDEQHAYPAGLEMAAFSTSGSLSHLVSAGSSARPMLDFNRMLSTGSLVVFGDLFASMQPFMSVPLMKSLVTDRLASSAPVYEISSLWILSQALGSHESKAHIVSDPVYSLKTQTDQILWTEIALEKAVAVLTKPEANPANYKVQILALEIITKIARLQGAEFRLTFFDTLYPLIQMLGAENLILRGYAINCLNYISAVCCYENAGELIVDNVDYLVNAIALKLNTFEIDPRASQILVMMLELSGAALIPYLDDILDSIFAILASYHGYLQLVDVLFSVLYTIVKQASSSEESNQLQIEHQQTKKECISFKQAIGLLKDTNATQHQAESARPPVQKRKGDGTFDVNEADLLEEVPPEEEKPPQKTKMYLTVQSIVRLCQHYLSQGQAVLRKRLLDLITSGCSIMSTNEDEFLPLVNDIWPMIIQRLYDPEPSVIIAAAETLSKLCEEAGDFLTSRIESDWLAIGRLFEQLVERASTANVARADRSSLSIPKVVLGAMIELLVEIVLHVRLTSEMEDDVFSMLTPFIETNPRAMQALQELNGDFLWLEVKLARLTYNSPDFKMATFVEHSLG